MINLNLDINIIYSYLVFYKIKYDSLSSSVDFDLSVADLDYFFSDIINKCYIKLISFDNNTLKDNYYYYILQESEEEFISKFYSFQSNLIFT